MRANAVVCALLLREMTRAGLINPAALKQEALATAEKLEPPGSSDRVAKLITSLFGGEPMQIPPQVVLRVIQGDLGRAAETARDHTVENADDAAP